MSRFSVTTHATVFLNPGALPTGFPGTQPLSNTGGGSITSPGLGSTYVFTIFPGYTTTIVAAPYNSVASAGTGTGLTTPSATSTQKSAARINQPMFAGFISRTALAIWFLYNFHAG